MTISLIAALSTNRAIGKNNDLPWKLPDDMKYFMAKTSGHHVILGRKNYESLPEKYRPLPNRVNLVLTHQPQFEAPGSRIIHTLEEGIEFARNHDEKELFIIGGAQVYQVALPHADVLYLTEIHAHIEGDTFFPEVRPSQWRETSRIPHAADSKHRYAFDFVTYERVKTFA